MKESDICRYLPAGQRTAVWESLYGPVPEGMRVGWNCLVAYCWNPEHMVLAENLNAHRRSWVKYRDRLLNLQPGEYFDDLEMLNDEQSINNCTAALSHTMRLVKFQILGLNHGGKGVRFVNIGRWALTDGDGLIVGRQNNLKCHRVQPWHKTMSVWLGQSFNPHTPIPFPKCAVKSCVHPTFRWAGEYCYQHNHFFDYDISMTWNGLDRASMYSPREKSKPWELATEFLTATDSLEKSLRFSLAAPKHRNPVYDERHKNAGALDPKPTIQRVGLRLRHRLGGGSHSSSKTTAGRKRAMSRDGKGRRHTTKEKRWSRETIEALEREADLILGIGTPELIAKADMMKAEQRGLLMLTPEPHLFCNNYEVIDDEVSDEQIEQARIAELFDKQEEFEELFSRAGNSDESPIAY